MLLSITSCEKRAGLPMDTAQLGIEPARVPPKARSLISGSWQGGWGGSESSQEHQRGIREVED